MTNYSLSQYFGFKNYYFGSMQCNAKDKYDFVMSFDDDKIKSVKLYVEYVKNTILKMQNILDFYEGKEWMYGKILFDNKISNYGAGKQVYLEDVTSIYTPRAILQDYLAINFSTLQRWESTILLLYKKLFLRKLFLYLYRRKVNKVSIIS